MTSDIPVLDAGDYFLAMAASEGYGYDLVSNLKLQKLVYYAQGFHLAIYNEPLFNDVIEAWNYGPVSPVLYYAKEKEGKGPLKPRAGYSSEMFSKKQRKLLDEVYEVYGQFSAWRLRDMVYSEPPWLNSDRGGIISHHDLKAYFETQIEKD